MALLQRKVSASKTAHSARSSTEIMRSNQVNHHHHHHPYELLDSTTPPAAETSGLIPEEDENVEQTRELQVEQQQEEQERIIGFDPFFHFLAMAILFSANHGCVVACLSLATARLGSVVGAFQSSVLYLSYTFSAILGATLVVKQMGARDSLIAGMGLYCLYVACFWVATAWSAVATLAAMLGAVVGGMGAGFLWTAQGAYFAKSSKTYAASVAQQQQQSSQTVVVTDNEGATSYLGGIFAFIYLAEEVTLKLLSTILIETLSVSWGTVFGVYTLVAIVSTFGMLWVHDYGREEQIVPVSDTDAAFVAQQPKPSLFYKMTAAAQLLIKDPKMKYMIGLNAVFGLAGAFLNSYVNGQVVYLVFGDDSNVGLLSALIAVTAAVSSLVFGRAAQSSIGKGPILILGAIAFGWVGGAFLIRPDIANQWTATWLISIYAIHGVGRATFEGTLRATFADYFSSETEGAFANIILQNGLSSTIGYFLSIVLKCSNEEREGCVAYRDGSLHDVRSFELLIVFSAIFAIIGYWRASAVYNREQNARLDRISEADPLDIAAGEST